MSAVWLKATLFPSLLLVKSLPGYNEIIGHGDDMMVKSRVRHRG
jgi:hypothetical protein